MTMIVFVGPTLPVEDVESCGPFVCLPPVAQGDLYRAARARPKAIGIIDGYFSGAPSVWHKEILWAISQGVAVFGSASMGALRAAETHGFGMRGVGRVFEAFRDGALEDDDEVAVVHGPAELGYLAASEAMVNIRATLARAEIEGVVDASTRRTLEAFAKSLFFPQRNWETILEEASAQGVPHNECAKLRDWLAKGRIDQKRLDALQMLEVMLQAPAPAPCNFNFEWTVFWDELVHRCEASAEPDEAPGARVLDELRLEGPDRYAKLEALALLRGAADRDPFSAGALTREALQESLADLRARLGLFTRAELDRWMAANGLDERALERLLTSERRLDQWRRRWRGALAPFLIDELRSSGDYSRLAERARKKAQALSDRSSLAKRLGPDAAGPVALRLWFFEQRHGLTFPDDIEAAARALGFADAAALDAALLREHLFAEQDRSQLKT